MFEVLAFADARTKHRVREVNDNQLNGNAVVKLEESLEFTASEYKLIGKVFQFTQMSKVFSMRRHGRYDGMGLSGHNSQH